MHIFRTSILAFLLTLSTFSAFAAAPERSDAQVKELKVLAIGNSFSANATELLPKLAASGGSNLVFGHAMLGSCSFETHLKLAKKHEAVSDAPEGRPYKQKDGGSLSLKELLLKERWDVVTIQQVSSMSYKPETFHPSADELCAYIRKYAPQAEISIHETWAYRPDNTRTYKSGFTALDMYKGTASAYAGLAKDLGIKRIIPVGDAFQLVYELQPFEFDKSYDAANPPDKLPPQQNSLNVGWMMREGKPFYDHGHANIRGKYLGALVWYEKLFKGDATKLSFKPNDISEEDAAFLRSIAHDVVSNGRLPEASQFRK